MVAYSVIILDAPLYFQHNINNQIPRQAHIQKKRKKSAANKLTPLFKIP